MVSPVSVTASSTFSAQFGDFGADNIINQSGLSDTYVSGETSFNDFTAATSHAKSSSTAGVGNFWSSGFLSGSQQVDSFPVTLDFDFGESINLVALAIWPNSDGSFSNIQDFSVFISDFSDFSESINLGSFTASNPGGTTTFADTFTLEGVGQYVRIEIASNYGSAALVNTSEIAFGVESTVVIPEASTWMLMGLGGIMVLGSRRFLRRAA